MSGKLYSMNHKDATYVMATLCLTYRALASRSDWLCHHCQHQVMGYDAYVGVTSKTPEERFMQHTTPGHRLAANGLPENGICLLKSLMHPFIKVPGRLKLQYETAMHLALSLAVPRVTGDIRDDYLQWLPDLQPRLMKALNETS